MYSEFENSIANGYPVELFEFTVEGQKYRYVHHDDDVSSIDEYVWTAAMLKRSRFTSGTELARSGISITVSPELPLLEVFVDGIPDSLVELICYRLHLTDPDNQKWLFWRGEVTSVKRSSREITLVCEPPESSLRSVGLRRRYQGSCPYPLYEEGCFAVRANHEETATVVSVSGLEVKLSLADCSHLIGGYLYQLKGGFGRYRHLSNGNGDTVTMTRPASWLLATDQVTLYRGCNRTTKDCHEVHHNLDNYGGFPFMPETNLFNKKVF